MIEAVAWLIKGMVRQPCTRVLRRKKEREKTQFAVQTKFARVLHRISSVILLLNQFGFSFFLQSPSFNNANLITESFEI